MRRAQWALAAAYLILSMVGVASMAGCGEGAKTGTQAEVKYDPEKDRQQHEEAQKKYMEEQAKQGAH